MIDADVICLFSLNGIAPAVLCFVCFGNALAMHWRQLAASDRPAGPAGAPQGNQSLEQADQPFVGGHVRDVRRVTRERDLLHHPLEVLEGQRASRSPRQRLPSEFVKGRVL